MKTIVAALLFCFAMPPVLAQTCAGPGPCVPGSGQLIGPDSLCLAKVCQPVRYAQLDDFVTAVSALPDGYPVMGWAGPCHTPNLAQDCPAIAGEAFLDLKNGALHEYRARRTAP